MVFRGSPRKSGAGSTVSSDGGAPVKTLESAALGFASTSTPSKNRAASLSLSHFLTLHCPKPTYWLIKSTIKSLVLV